MSTTDKIDDKKQEHSTSKNDSPKEELVCPKCGSHNIHIDKKGYSAGSGCCGAILLGPLGLLCGASGANKIRKTCLKCDGEF